MLLVACSVTLLSWAPSGSRGSDATTAPADSKLVFIVEVGSRLYPDWHETVHVRLFESFFLADTDLTARIERFVPDFRISDSGEIISHSQNLANPAIHVITHGDSASSDSTWAFLNFPPHFSRDSFFTFQLKEIQGYESPTSAHEPALKREDEDG